MKCEIRLLKVYIFFNAANLIKRFLLSENVNLFTEFKSAIAPEPIQNISFSISCMKYDHL